MVHTTSILLAWLLAVSAGGAQHGPHQELAVVYDSDRGYPRSVQVDYRQMTKDEEMRLKVTDFKMVRR